MTDQATSAVRAVFAMLRPTFLEPVAGEFVDDPGPLVEDAAARFDRMIPDLACVDKPDQVMAMPLFFSCATLALYLTLAEHGVDLHDYGAAALAHFGSFAEPMGEPEDLRYTESLVAAGEASGRCSKWGMVNSTVHVPAAAQMISTS